MLRRGALLATVSLVFAGAAHAGSPSPCSLATTAQVKAAFGGTVSAGKVDNSTGVPACHFKVTHSNLGVSGEAIVFITPGQSAATFKIAKKEVPGAISVSGIANGAFYVANTDSIELLKGSTVASAQGVFLDSDAHPIINAKSKADVIVLAKIVAKNA
ncbi:MAG: hypothetical protein JOY73_09740 [Actinobacteria bacterium]|nr:hypothetical protein [Actinomycetota bacterium]